MFLTQNGTIKKTVLEQFSRPRAMGIRAITLDEGDKVVSVALTDGSQHLVIATRAGKAIHFNEATVRGMGRNAAGVRGIQLQDGNDAAIGMVAVSDPQTESILVVSEKGYGKRSLVDDYRITNRGGKGVITIAITEKTGDLIAIKLVTDDHDIMIINKSGVTIRLAMADVRVMGRNTQGVRLINLEKRGDKISSVCRTDHYEEPEEVVEGAEPAADAQPAEPVAPEVPADGTELNPEA